MLTALRSIFRTPDWMADFVEAFVRTSLEPDEQVAATLSYSNTGSLFKVAMPVVGGLFWSSFKTLALVATNRRVLVVALEGLLENHPRLVAGFSRTETKVVSWHEGPILGTLELSLGTTQLGLQVRRAWEGQAQQLVDALEDTVEHA